MVSQQALQTFNEIQALTSYIMLLCIQHNAGLIINKLIVWLGFFFKFQLRNFQLHPSKQGLEIFVGIEKTATSIGRADSVSSSC